MTQTRNLIRNYIDKAVRVPVADDEDIFAMALVDSLFAIQLVSFVETQFAISVEREDLDINNFCSIGAIVAFVARKTEGT